MLGLIGLAFIQANGYIKTAEINEKAVDKQVASTDRLIEHEAIMLEWRYGAIQPAFQELGNVGNQTNSSIIYLTE